jgi:hypothetical protein
MDGTDESLTINFHIDVRQARGVHVDFDVAFGGVHFDVGLGVVDIDVAAGCEGAKEDDKQGAKGAHDGVSRG